MVTNAPAEFVAECLWPGVGERDLRALDARAHDQAQRLAADGGSVRYLGSLLMREDEVVLCLFEGDKGEIREVAEAAHIPYDRILETARSPWNDHAANHSGATGGDACGRGTTAPPPRHCEGLERTL